MFFNKVSIPRGRHKFLNYTINWVSYTSWRVQAEKEEKKNSTHVVHTCIPCHAFKKSLTTLTTEIIHCTFTSQFIAFYEHGTCEAQTATRGHLCMISKSNNSLKATMAAGAKNYYGDGWWSIHDDAVNNCNAICAFNSDCIFDTKKNTPHWTQKVTYWMYNDGFFFLHNYFLSEIVEKHAEFVLIPTAVLSTK